MAATAAVVLLLAGVSLVTAACGGDDDDAPRATALTTLKVGEPALVAAGIKPQDTSPFGYALARGVGQEVLAEYGFKYGGLTPFSTGPPVAQALASGDIDLALIGDTPAILARANGLASRAVFVAAPWFDPWLVGRKGGAATVAQLKGKRVGLQFGSNFEKYGRQLLKTAGIAGDVQVVNLSVADSLAALQRGQIDAVAAPSTVAELWHAKARVPIIDKGNESHPELAGTTVATVTPAFLKAHPKIGAAYWATVQAGIKLIKADQPAYVAFYAKATGLPPAVVAAAYRVVLNTVPIDPQGVKALASTLDFQRASGTARAAFSIPDWVADPAKAGS